MKEENKEIRGTEKKERRTSRNEKWRHIENDKLLWKRHNKVAINKKGTRRDI